MHRLLGRRVSSTAGRGVRAAIVAFALVTGMQQAAASPDAKPGAAAGQPSASVTGAVEPANVPGRHEVTLYPAVVQLNVRDTLHVGVAASYGFRVQERIALKVMPLYNYLRSDGLVERPSSSERDREALHSPVLVRYGAVGGVELAALSGTMAVGEGTATFDLMLDFGAGAGTTGVQLRPDSLECKTGGPACLPASSADAGLRLLTHAGAGVRVSLGEHVMIRLEVRDLIFASGYSKLNGCTFKDIDNLDRGLAASSSCRADAFGNDGDKWLARHLLEERPGSLSHLVSVYGGVGFLF